MTVSRYSKELVAVVVELLHEHREVLGVSKKKLASDAGVSRTSIILMESSKRLPSLELVIKLAMGLGLSFSSILREAEERMEKKLPILGKPSARSERHVKGPGGNQVYRVASRSKN